MTDNENRLDAALVKCFGPDIASYWWLTELIISQTTAQEYSFMNMRSYERILTEEHDFRRSNQIYWTEMLYRAHLACISSLRRHVQWARATCQAYLTANFPSFAASLRGFVESTADSADFALRMPKNLAHSHASIKSCVEGKASTILTSGEMEELLIHYSHARKEKKGKVPEAHIAKTSADNLRVITETAKLQKAKDLYRELCEVTHPAAMSVYYMFDTAEDAEGNSVNRWSEIGDQRAIEAHLFEFRDTIPGIATLAFEPQFLTLKTLHRFGLFPVIQELKKFSFRLDYLAEKIERMLKT